MEWGKGNKQRRNKKDGKGIKGKEITRIPYMESRMRCGNTGGMFRGMDVEVLQ